MPRSVAHRTPVFVAAACVLAGFSGSSAQVPQASSGQLPTYKAGIDLVRVDAHVVDRDGKPVPGLRTTDFVVTVDGKTRKVVTADFVKLTGGRGATGEGGSPVTGAAPVRRYILVIDQHNIQPGGLKVAATAAKSFLGQLGPDDQVAMVVVPAGGSVTLTTDHQRVARALDDVQGTGEVLRSEVFAHVSVSESLRLENVGPDACEPGGRMPATLATILERNGCLAATMPESERSSCCQQIVGEIRAQVVSIQQATSQSLMSLQSLFGALRGIEGRKTIILMSQRLVTGGAGSLDRRNDLRNVGRMAGAANANLYVLHLSRGLFEGIDTSVRQEAALPFGDEAAGREGLEEIAGAAGGGLFQVVAGADFAFERIARETSAYYLLGLEPLPDDRDGKPHQIRVRTVLSGATVRARTEFVIPKVDVAVPPPPAQAAEPAPSRPPDRAPVVAAAPAPAGATPATEAAAARPAAGLPPFDRADVLRPEVTGHFVRRLEATVGDPSPAMKDALDAARNGRFDVLLDSLAASPNDAAARVLWGVALMMRGDMDNAGAEFRAALAIDSELSPAQFYLGAWHASQGNDPEAVRSWQAVLSTEFDQPAVFEVLIDALLRVGQVGRAGALLEEARSQWRDDRLTPRTAAVAVASGDYRGALDTLAPYLERYPGDARTLALAMRAIAYAHAKGGTVFDAATDRERVARYAQLYEKAGGTDKAAVAGWLAAVK